MSIRSKLLLASVGVLLTSLGAYQYFAASLFQQDKMDYVASVNTSLLTSATEHTRALVAAVMKETDLLALAPSWQNAHELFVREPDVLRVRLGMVDNGHYRATSSFVNMLRPTESLSDVENWPWKDLATDANRQYIQNTSTATVPSLTLVYRRNNVVIIVDFRHDGLLHLLASTKPHETFLVDSRGVVLAHPNRTWVLQHQVLLSSPLVRGAISSANDRDYDDFLDGNEGEQIGGFERVGVADMWVVTQISKGEALRVGRQLQTQFAWFSAAVLLLALLGTMAFARHFTQPILWLREDMERLSHGNYEMPKRPWPRDEIGDLARAFQGMGRQIKETQAQLIQSEKMSAFGQLGVGITHEVKNPMTTIVGFTQLAQRSLAEPERARELLALVEKEALRCQQLLVNFLKFARSSTGSFTPVDVNELVQETARMLHHQLNTGKVKLDVSVGAALPKVLGNPAELQQVFLNLAVNAQYAMPAGGTLRFSTRLTANREVEIAVADTGPGIPGEYLERVFEPFFTTKPPGEGTGLGLSVTFSIIRGHKGTIEALSPAGHGAHFIIRLPTV